MSGRPIDDQIREHYLAQAPRRETLERLEPLIRQAAAPPRRPENRPGTARTAVAAAILVAVTGANWLALKTVPASPGGVALTLARQAAAGHNGGQELEVRARSFGELRAQMKSLDFTPAEPRRVRETSMRLVGARYTTLAGVIAAQIVLHDPAGVPCTLYEARPVGGLATVSSGDFEVDGLEVTIWREKGLLMILTRPLA